MGVSEQFKEEQENLRKINLSLSLSTYIYSS